MKAFLEWMAASRFRMVLLAAIFGLLPLFGLLSQAVIVFAVLVHGVGEGLLILALASALLTVPVVLSGTAPTATLLVALGSWLPVLALAFVLLRSRSLSLVAQVATLVVAALVALAFLVADPVAQWQDMFARYAGQLPPQFEQLPAEARAGWSEVMTGVLGVLTLLSTLLAVFLGRWWQSILQRPGAFGMEFRGLRLGLVLALAAAVVFVVAGLTGQVALSNITLVLAAAFLLQGLAVVHSVVAMTGVGSFWLVGTYALLFVAAPFAGLGLASIGFVDSWFNLRSRLERR